jgi:hypothetical protein
MPEYLTFDVTFPALPGFHSARKILNAKEAYIVHGGEGEWPLAAGIRAASLPHLMKRLQTS